MTGVLVTQLIVAAGLTLVTQAIQIGAYGARLAGVITGRIATAISLFSLFVTASRLANLVATPAMGALADTPANAAQAAHTAVIAALQSRHVAHAALVAPQAAVTPAQLHVFDTQMRIIVAAGSIGILVGGLLMPVFIVLFVRGVRAFERLGSIPAALLRLVDPRVLADLVRAARLPSIGELRALPYAAIPGKLIVGNTVIMMVYSIGVVAAYYASVLNLDARGTAIGLSGLVNGIGTVAFSLFVDPTSSYIVDQTARDERPIDHVRAMIVALIASAFVGTLLAQLILFPAAEYIALGTHLFKR